MQETYKNYETEELVRMYQNSHNEAYLQEIIRRNEGLHNKWVNDYVNISGKLYCANCDKVLWKHKSNGYVNWYCSGNYGKGNVACEVPSRTSTVAVRKTLEYIAKELVAVDKRAVKKSIVDWLESLKQSLSSPIDKAVFNDIERLERKRSKLLEAYLEEMISKEDYKVKYEELESKLKEKKKLIVPVEENEDIKEIENILKNIDAEIEEYINAPNFEDNKVDWLIEHTKKITVCNNKHYVIELDLVAGAIIAGKDFLAVCAGTDAVRPWRSL